MDGTHTVIAKPTFYPQQKFYHKSESSFVGKKEGKIETSSSPTQPPSPISPGEQLAHWLSSPLPHVALGGARSLWYEQDGDIVATMTKMGNIWHLSNSFLKK